MEIDSGIFFKVLLLIFLLVASAFFASSEAALFSLGRFRIRRLLGIDARAHGAAKTLLNKPTNLITTLLIGNEVVNAAIGIVGSSLVYQLLSSKVEHSMMPLMAIVCVLPFLLIFGEIVPKTLGLKHSEKVSAFNARPLLTFSNAVGGLRRLLVWGPDKILKMMGSKHSEETVSEDVFRAMVDASLEEGVLDRKEQTLIHNVLKLDDIKVANIMTPFSKMSILKNTDTIGTAREHMLTDSFSRFPVLNEDNQAIGVLYAKDLIDIQRLSSDLPIQKFIRKAFFIDHDNNALELFTQLKMNKIHFSLVKNDEQRLIGLITLEDVLEEVFGDIKDERDIEEES